MRNRTGFEGIKADACGGYDPNVTLAVRGKDGGWRVMIGVIIFLVSQLSSLTPASAQEAPEYRMELGAAAGTVAYQGDFNGGLMSQMQPTGAIVAKYKPNPRMAWTAALSYGQLKGSSKNVETWYPELQENPIEFSSQLTALDLRYEYNFWPFGTGREYFGARHLTPFITLGTGLCFAKPKDGKSAVGLQLPIGVGVKYKLGDRLNLAAEWTMHFTGTDGLDGVKDPYGIKSSGMFKNTDCYSVFAVSLTYDLWAKCKTCMNDRD